MPGDENPVTAATGAVTNDVTKKIARLARLRLSETEVEQYTKELGKILSFVEQLKEANVEGVEPVIHGIPLDAHFREDTAVVLSEEKTKQIVSCSEQSLYDQFRVPQVIGGE
jgi:aspartyl-tRNA(Asn)/glutamyl-tRNA(Gln) amidotransferase subunit C